MRIHQYSIADHLVYLIIGTIVQAIALQFAYKNVKFVSKEKNEWRAVQTRSRTD